MGVEAAIDYCSACPSLAWFGIPGSATKQPWAGKLSLSFYLRIKAGLHALLGSCQHQGPTSPQALSVREAASFKLSTTEQRSLDFPVGPLGPCALRLVQIAYSLRPDLKGSLQRSRVNLLCLQGVCAFLRPKAFSSKGQRSPAVKLSFPSPALPLSPPSSVSGFCFSYSLPP